MSIHRLESSVRHYPWGARSWIADLLGRPASGEPEAELWVGAHPGCPSRVLGGDGTTLDRLIASAPSKHLGDEVHERFGARLPFLFKVLAAEQPLSLQAHPDAEQAREGFARENAAGVPLDAAERSYKDDQHKPELICALTPFAALHGFRPAAEALEVLGAFGVAEPTSPLFDAWRHLRESPDATGLRRFFTEVFRTPRDRLDEVIVSGIERVAATPAERLRRWGDLPAWFARLAALYPGDPGVVIALTLQLVELAPGEALFLGARNLHAYLGGLGLEVMASSDNVLRGGMTHKHVDVAELARVVEFASLPVDVLHPVEERTEPGVRVARYPSRAAEFELALVTLEPGASWSLRGPGLVVGLEGEGTAEAAGERAPLARGTQLFCDAQHEVQLVGPCRLAVTTVRHTG
ncbi:MAG TPA: mannose-6-phosphate isomerase, class I [Polyangiaceae bacterium]|nr:mannose-6-phosphate isomerase, class I [Polyangiaceae bacterium]